MSKFFLHVASLDKFIPPLIEFMRKELPEQTNRFYTFGQFDKYPYKKGKDTVHAPRKRKLIPWMLSYLPLLIEMHKADKIVLHSLFNKRIVYILFFNPWLLKKCYWVIWGGDLHRFNEGKASFNKRRNEFFRRFVIKRMGHLVSYIEGDIELTRNWYGADGPYCENLMYLSNTFSPIKLKSESSNTLNIQIGNSADTTNEHVEVLEKLIPYKDQDIRIFVPLSYGNAKHRERVIEKGTELFGDKFVPMTDFLPYEAYLDFLGQIDVAIFNHKRQQAMGNTISLLGLGKTVYLRSDAAQWDLFASKSIKVFDVKDLQLRKLSSEDVEKNIAEVSRYFSYDNLIAQYKTMLGS